jgi:hypothetical protein
MKAKKKEKKGEKESKQWDSGVVTGGPLLALNLEQHAKILADLHQLIAVVGHSGELRVARGGHAVGHVVVHGRGHGHGVVAVPSRRSSKGSRAVQLGRSSLTKEGGRDFFGGTVSSGTSENRDGQACGSRRVVECGTCIERGLFLDEHDLVGRVGLCVDDGALLLLLLLLLAFHWERSSARIDILLLTTTKLRHCWRRGGTLRLIGSQLSASGGDFRKRRQGRL